MIIKDKVMEFLEDYSEEIGIMVFAFVGSNARIVQEFLENNGWTSNDFFLGVIGALITLLFNYLRGKKKKGKSVLDRGVKGLVSLILGGIIAMILSPVIPFANSIVGVTIGSSFQLVWNRWIASFFEKFFPDSNSTASKAAEDGEDRPEEPR